MSTTTRRPDFPDDFEVAVQGLQDIALIKKINDSRCDHPKQYTITAISIDIYDTNCFVIFFPLRDISTEESESLKKIRKRKIIINLLNIARSFTQGLIVVKPRGEDSHAEEIVLLIQIFNLLFEVRFNVASV